MGGRPAVTFLTGSLAISLLLVVLAVPSRAAPIGSPVTLLAASAAPPLPPGSAPLGRLRPSRELHLDVTLRIPHPAVVQGFLADLSDRSSPLFHHFVAGGQFAARFGPSRGEVATVAGALRRAGLSVDSVAGDRLVLKVDSTALVVERAFHLSLALYRLPSGRVAFANTSAPELPTRISIYVEGVLGLNDLYPEKALIAPTMRRLARRPQRASGSPSSGTAGASPCLAASEAASANHSLTADQLALHYSMSSLYGLGDLGQGVRVALVELEPNLHSDVAAYARCYGLATAVNYHEIDGGAGTGAGVGEATLDIEDVMGLAPGATIDVYQAPNDDDYDDLAAIVDDDADEVISTSWGLCELDQDPSFIDSEQALFEQASSQGQTVISAAGDAGSTDCLGDPETPYSSTPAVDDPASQPYVVGVGGSSIGQDGDSVWNDSAVQAGAGGGGVSRRWCMPSYQDQATIRGLIGADSVSSPGTCGTTSENALMRQVPDVSADGDPLTGYTIYYTGPAPGLDYGWGPIGGTSGAAPLWAAAAALIDGSPFCADYGSGDPGALPEGLYAVAARYGSYIYASGGYEALRDVTKGDNDYTPSGYGGGLYKATPGYDMASGLGTPVLGGLTSSGAPSDFFPGLAALMCFQYATRNTSTSIASVSPDIGATVGPTAVHISGTGFLPIPGADRLQVGPQTVTASCASTTSCRALLPAEPAGTVDLRMHVEDLSTSPVTATDRFSFATAPVVRLSSPHRYQATTHLAIDYSATASSPAVSSYDVRFRFSSFKSRQKSAYLYPSSWQDSTRTSQSMNGTPGQEYCYDVRARSDSGVVSPWSADRCAVVPLGSRSLEAVTGGWSRVSGPGYYLGSAIETTRAGAELRLVGAAATRIALVVTECPTCRAVTVYMNGRALKTVSTHSATTRHSALIVLPPFPERRATILLKATGRGRQLVVEGIGIG